MREDCITRTPRQNIDVFLFLRCYRARNMPSLLEGIEAKYGRDSEDFSALGIPILYVTRSNANAVPPVLVFNDFGIDSAGSEECLKSKCQNVQELDLAQNSLCQWTEVGTNVKNDRWHHNLRRVKDDRLIFTWQLLKELPNRLENQ